MTDVVREVVSCSATEVFGSEVSFQMRLIMLRTLSSENGLTGRKVWFGQWSAVVQSLLKIMLSNSVINFRYNCDEAVRVISTVFDLCDLHPYLPAFNLTLRVQDEQNFMNNPVIVKTFSSLLEYLCENNKIVDLYKAFLEVSQVFFLLFFYTTYMLTNIY